MAKWICQDCGTQCTTSKGDEMPQPILWNDGHSCLWMKEVDPIQTEILKLQGEINDLKFQISELKGDLNPDDTSVCLGSLNNRLERLEAVFRETLGTSILEKYGSKQS